MEPKDNESAQGWRVNHGLIPGVIVIGIGILFLLDNFHVVYVRDWWRYWPVALIAVGLVKLVDSNFGSGRVVGGIMMGAGAILLANNLGLIDATIDQLWPLILIAIGLAMLGQRIWGPLWVGPRYRRWDRRLWGKHGLAPEALKQSIEDKVKHRWSAGWSHPGDDAGEPSGFRLNEVAIFGGGKRKVTAQDFKGGELTAIFGGFEVDLRQAGMIADSAILEVNTVFGGAEIKIPYSWTAVVQGVGIFGGYGDETEPPEPATSPKSKKLFIRGAAVFGGVSVKN
ncbi:MAG TPA: DUF5668 domain-containing protein [Candidatus Acidoferrales bacterium]|jgi:hypothetical protein|nr:DUF5668 domain-containing protein [Candidatus Acidoferrales bacterium]